MSLAGALAALRAAALGLLAVMVLVLVAWATAADSGASATEAVAGGLALLAAGFSVWIYHSYRPGRRREVDLPDRVFINPE